MLRVGLSGGIGSGKSTVAGRLAERGAVVLDADAIAREVVEPGTPGLARVVHAFGAELLDADGALDRKALAARVFADDEARTTLNGILHPLIGARTAELMADAPPDAIVVHDVPLLVENHLAPSYHLVLMVHAPQDVRVRRLSSARGVAEADARARIAAQATQAQRAEVTDVWLDNSGGPDEVLSIVDKLWTDRLVSYEANVRLARPARLPDDVTPAAPDPRWPDIARRLAARISAACGERAIRVDHIGATAVPGMPAQDVIDLQVTVSSPEQAAAVGPLLTGAGFAHLTDAGQHAAANEQAEWVHAACDPGRPALLYVRSAGSAGQRAALLLRDWLRADEQAAAEYRELIRSLTGRSRSAYADARRPWFGTARERAEDWAARTGWQPPV